MPEPLLELDTHSLRLVANETMGWRKSEELGPIRMGSGMACVCVETCNSNLKIDKVFHTSLHLLGFCICCLLFCRSTLQLLSNCEMLCNRTLTAAEVDFTIGMADAIAFAAPHSRSSLPFVIHSLIHLFKRVFFALLFCPCEANTQLKPFLNVRQRSILVKRKLFAKHYPVHVGWPGNLWILF